MATSRLTQEEQDLIDYQRSIRQATLRPTVQTLENRLYTPIPLLDHGFVRVVDYMGEDLSVVQAARVSYGTGMYTRDEGNTGAKQRASSKRLIRYLMRQGHTTPFEMCEIKLHVKLPIFVARQWIRHRTANVNEVSARYSILDREFYVPEPEVIASQSVTNRQGRGDTLSYEQATAVQTLLQEDGLRAYDHYQELLNEDRDGNPDPGIARELARLGLTLGYYTQWYWKIDLHNLLHFLKLRADSHAQYEIRVYAEAILEEIVKPWVPMVYEAFLDYQLNARTLSAQAIKMLRRLIVAPGLAVFPSAEELYDGIDIDRREWGELMEMLGFMQRDPVDERTQPAIKPTPTKVDSDGNPVQWVGRRMRSSNPVPIVVANEVDTFIAGKPADDPLAALRKRLGDRREGVVRANPEQEVLNRPLPTTKAQLEIWEREGLPVPQRVDHLQYPVGGGDEDGDIFC